jgi:hypothetical protein
MKTEEEARAMYEYYLEGRSYAEVGLIFGMSRQAVSQFFKRRGLETRPNIYFGHGPQIPLSGVQSVPVVGVPGDVYSSDINSSDLSGVGSQGY